MHSDKKLNKKDYSEIRKRIDIFLTERQSCSFRNIFRSERISWKLIVEYYSLRKILKKDFKQNAELNEYIKILPLNSWITFYYVYEIVMLVISIFLFYMFFVFLPLVKGALSFSIGLIILTAFFLNEYVKRVNNDMFYSLKKISECKKSNYP